MVDGFDSDDVSGLTAGPDGNLWVTDANRQTILRVTSTGTVTPFRDGPLFPQAMTYDDQGNLWIANQLGGVTRQAPSGAITQFDGPALARPLGITIGPDGSAWVYVMSTPTVRVRSPG